MIVALLVVLAVIVGPLIVALVAWQQDREEARRRSMMRHPSNPKRTSEKE